MVTNDKSPRDPRQVRSFGDHLWDETINQSHDELELELIQTQMTQKPMLRVEVGARALRNQTGGGGGWEGASSAVCGSARSSVCVGPSKPETIARRNKSPFRVEPIPLPS